MISPLAKPILFPAIPKRLQKRKPVTIAAGFKFKDGILVCADTQYTSSVKFHQSKISSATVASDKFDYLEMVFAMSGTDGHMQMAVEVCEDAISRCDVADSGFIYEARDQCASALATLYEKHFFPHKLYGYEGGPSASLIIGIYVTGEGSDLLWTHETAVTFADKYHIVGSGSDLARYAIEPLFQDDLTLDEVTLLATHALRVTKQGDPYCGEKSQFAAIFDSGLTSEVEEFEVIQGESYSETFQGIMRKLFFAGADVEMTKYDIGEMIDDVKLEIGVIRREQQREREKRQKLIQKLSEQ